MRPRDGAAVDDGAVRLLEQLAERSPALREGERKLTVVFSNASVRRAFVELGPLRPDELERTLG